MQAASHSPVSHRRAATAQGGGVIPPSFYSSLSSPEIMAAFECYCEEVKMAKHISRRNEIKKRKSVEGLSGAHAVLVYLAECV